jgi:hypothetical protein
MAAEYFVSDSIVVCLRIKAPAIQMENSSGEPWFRRITKIIRVACLPKEDDIKLFDGRAFNAVYANNLDPKYSCSWTDTADGGGYGQIVVSVVDQPRLRSTIAVKIVVSKDSRWSWLTVDFNPTSLTAGNNVHPAAFIDPQTGLPVIWPSSSWPAITRTFRLGFEFLEVMSEPNSLFDADTKLAIERGDFHIVRVQYAATKDVLSVTEFLQVGAVIYGQTIARGRGIINNAKYLGLRFKPFGDPDSSDNRLSGFMLQKLHGKKLHASVAFYDKVVRLRQMHQEATLSVAEARTVNQSVRQDITAHSSFVERICDAAWEKLANMDEADRKFFNFLSPEEFLQGTPQPTVWWLQRAIYLLSHRREKGRWKRYSFATWLVPFVEKEVLQCDVIADITTEGYHALLALQDKVADAWRSDPTPGASNWPGRLAHVAGCTRSTVYNRRDKWRKAYGIDIAYPLQMYSDILFFGHNSVAKPENITAMMVAVDQEDGSELVRLHAEALAGFEKKRIEIVNPALVNPPRAMESKLPLVAFPRFDDLPPDFDDIDLDEVEPTRPESARPNIALSSAKSGPRELGQGPMKKPRKRVVLRIRRKPAPPPTAKKVSLRATPSLTPPPDAKRVRLRR